MSALIARARVEQAVLLHKAMALTVMVALPLFTGFLAIDKFGAGATLASGVAAVVFVSGLVVGRTLQSRVFEIVLDALLKDLNASSSPDPVLSGYAPYVVSYHRENENQYRLDYDPPEFWTNRIGTFLIHVRRDAPSGRWFVHNEP